MKLNHLTSRCAGRSGPRNHSVSPLPARPSSSTPSPELDRIDTGGESSSGDSPTKVDVAFAALVFAVFATVAFAFYGVGAFREWCGQRWDSLRRWLSLCRQCAWCGSRLGGNPLAPVSHGICPHCLAAQKREIAAVIPIRHLTTTATHQ